MLRVEKILGSFPKAQRNGGQRWPMICPQETSTESSRLSISNRYTRIVLCVFQEDSDSEVGSIR